ncbi:nitrate- and nitrite sensing domain-containing protein [Streptomyces sp. NPDC048718]|uniref:sensor histidine kinase n=1 Tax=Streptomyces sp. NPDC048718 TaxID=3365587 RepID=UPI003715A25B
MRPPRRSPDDASPAHPPRHVRGRRAHAGPPADEPAPHERTPDSAPTHLPGPVPTPEHTPVPTVAPDPATRPEPRRPYRLRAAGPRTVRAKIVSLLMVPVVSLLALWGFATVTTAQDIAGLRRLQSADSDIRQPVVQAIHALQDERRAAVRQAAAPSTGRAAELGERARATDAAVARLRIDDRHTVGDSGGLPADVSTRVAGFVGRATSLARPRADAAAGRADRDRVYETYTGAITAGFAVGGALAGIEDTDAGPDARVLLELGRAGEMLAREDALLGSARLTGRLPDRQLRELSGAVETRRTLTDSATADLPAAQRAAWQRITAQPLYRRLAGAEDRTLAAAPGRSAAEAVTAADWDTLHTFVRDGLRSVERDGHTAAADRHDPLGAGMLSPGGAAVLLGLLAVAASLAVSVRVGRGLVVELVGLRNTALAIARRELPSAMRRLRAGENIDVRAEAPPKPAPHDEIGQVGEALTSVHRAALSAAVERAELADGISGVFVNLARRSQVLVHRQLTLLDSMERRADDPGELGDLFRLDHLTTRMRRHAESLIILSGAAPGRAWRTPVPLTSVVRAAVSEIEDYARVEIRRLPETAVSGAAVADLTHLLAELVENAAQFSPPHTKVRISGEPVGNGYALEIEDRGLGMGKGSLDEANARIARSEALDLFDSDRLGLFVVSRLSARHAVKVHLRPSPYGGTTAVVLLPTELLQSAPPVGHMPASEPDEAARTPEHTPLAPSTATPTGADVRTPPWPPRIPVPTAPAEEPAGVAPGPRPSAVTSLRRRPRGLPAAPPAPDVVKAAMHVGGDGDTTRGAGGPGGDDGDLPRRVRQASLVPQLRTAPHAPASAGGPAGAPPPAGAPTGPADRTPEQVRARMSAYHDGWRRGGGRRPGTPAPTPPGAPNPADPTPVPGFGSYQPRTPGMSAIGTPADPGREGDHA